MKRFSTHPGRRRRSTQPRSSVRRLRRRHILESLEDRLLLATIEVTTAVDVVATDGETSLREAIDMANADPDSDTITFDPSLTESGPATIVLALGELSITDAVKIEGPGAERLAINAKGQSRVVHVGTGDFDVTLSGFRLLGGLTAGDSEHGAGVRFDSTGTLMLREMSLATNLAQGDNADGGGVYASSGSVVVQRSDFAGNSAIRVGGAIATESGAVTIRDSTLRSNRAALGGGIHSTIADINVSRSTFSDNRAAGNGGGIAISSGGTATISNSTIAFNTADGNGGGLGFASSVNVTLESTIVGGNTTGDGTPSDIETDRPVNVFSSANLISDPNSAGGLTHGVLGNIVGRETGPLRGLLDMSTVLQPLARGGGPSPTHGLVAISPAIDAGVQTTDLIVNGGFETGDFTGWTVESQGGGQIDVNTGELLDPMEGQFDAIISQSSASLNALSQTVVVPSGVTSAFLSWSDRIFHTGGDFQDPIQEYRVLIEDEAGAVIDEIFSTNPGDANGQAGPNTRFFDVTTLAQSVEGQTIRVNFVEQDQFGPLVVLVDAVSLLVTANEGVAGDSDQRGMPFVRDDGGGVDIGAVERQILDPSLFVVTTEADGLDYTDGDVTLREAVNNANGSAGSEEVTFDASVSSVVLGQGVIGVRGDMTIRGPGPDRLTIDGDGKSQIFEISDGLVTRGSVHLSGMTLTGGFGQRGGAVVSFEDLTVSDSRVTGNTASDYGGGIAVSASLTITGTEIGANSAALGGGLAVTYGSANILRVTDSTISGNTADTGGGLINLGVATITGSTVSGNTAYGFGGGISNYSGSLTIQDSTISGNSSAYVGGGIHSISDLTVSASTVAGNVARTDGGGISAAGILSVAGSTLSGNTATGHGGGLHIRSGVSATITSTTITANDGMYGGGLYGDSDITSLTIENSIVAANTSGGSTPDLFARASIRSSLIGNNQGTIPFLPEARPGDAPDANGNFVGDLSGGGIVDPMLGPLADNGGPTLTHALLVGSPAIDAGDNSLLPPDMDDLDDDPNTQALPFDQRGNGFLRVSDGQLDGTAIVDMGAFELQRINQQPTFTATDPDPVLEDSGSHTVPFATFDPGDPSELGQSVLAYNILGISNPALFTTPPEMDTDGNLSFALAPDAFGISTFDVAVQDSGGTAGGGVDTSEVQQFQITVIGVNDAPSFALGPEVMAVEDAGARTILDFAAGFDPGPGEDGASTASQVIHDEGPDGTADPLSTDNNNPTDVGNLAHGSNIVRGHVDAAQTVGDVDVFRFTIDPGFQLDGLFVLEYAYVTPPSNPQERNAFLAINDGATFPYNAQELDFNQNPSLDESLFLGGTVFGLDDLPTANGADFLPRAGVITGRGFTPPLGAGTYTIYIQQTGPANTYSLDFRVTETSKQSVTAYSISDLSDTSLFSFGPLIDVDGSLIFTPAPDASGTATFNVVVRDNGGTDNGGVDTSMPMPATITIDAVNDKPTFTASDPPAVLQNAGQQSVTRFVSSFDPGPDDETSQTVLAYNVSGVSNLALFTTAPEVDISGNLTYTLAADVFGTSTFEVMVQDSGGTAGGGIDTSDPQVFTITVKEPLVVTFNDPDDIVAGTPLGATQLNASANLPGTFTYTPPAGTVLPVGANQTLAVGFTADDPFYDPVTVLASINVLPPPLELDYGDAPSGYPVTSAEDGARHVAGPLLLGTMLDNEDDGQPSAAADGDGADDDGVVFLADLVAVSGTATTASALVTASQVGRLDAWIDFDRDNVWEATERIANSVELVAGGNTLSFTVPAGAMPGVTAARFRLSSAGSLSPTGQSDDGEVEDYLVKILDGNASPDASVQLVGSASTVVTESGQLVVRVNPVLFSVPVDSLGRLTVHGIDADETITLDFSGGGIIPPGGLSLDGGGGSNTLAVAGADGEIDLTSSLLGASNFSTIDLGDDHVNGMTVDPQAIRSLAPGTGRARVVGGPRDAIAFGDPLDWRMGVTSVEAGRFIRQVVRSPVGGGNETLATDLPHAWQNVVQVSDVNNNGDVTAGDALVIINELARRVFSDPDSQLLDDPIALQERPGLYYDQNGDDRVTALDALRVINEVARVSNRSGEQELLWWDRAIEELTAQQEQDAAPAAVVSATGPPSPVVSGWKSTDAMGTTKKEKEIDEDLGWLILSTGSNLW